MWAEFERRPKMEAPREAEDDDMSERGKYDETARLGSERAKLYAEHCSNALEEASLKFPSLTITNVDLMVPQPYTPPLTRNVAATTEIKQLDHYSFSVFQEYYDVRSFRGIKMFATAKTQQKEKQRKKNLRKQSYENPSHKNLLSRWITQRYRSLRQCQLSGI